MRNSEHNLITKVHDRDVGLDPIHNPSDLLGRSWKWKVKGSLQCILERSHYSVKSRRGVSSLDVRSVDHFTTLKAVRRSPRYIGQNHTARRLSSIFFPRVQATTAKCRLLESFPFLGVGFFQDAEIRSPAAKTKASAPGDRPAGRHQHCGASAGI